MMGYRYGSWSGGDWLAMTGMMLLIWAVFGGLVVWAVRSVRGESRHPDGERHKTASPDDILAERYARGDTEEDEFRRRRELLHTSSGSGTRPRSTP